MKSFLLLLVCLLFVFSSCKKKADVIPVAGNTVSATVDGVNVNFSVDAFAYFSTFLPQYAPSLTINGETSISGNKALITISVASPTPITTGTIVSSDNGNAVAFSEITYEQAVTTSQLTQPYITDSKGRYQTAVTITSISSTHVKGTFNGILINSIDDTQPPKSITNGQFDLAINQ